MKKWFVLLLTVLLAVAAGSASAQTGRESALSTIANVRIRDKNLVFFIVFTVFLEFIVAQSIQAVL